MLACLPSRYEGLHKDASFLFAAFVNVILNPALAIAGFLLRRRQQKGKGEGGGKAGLW